MEDEEKFYEEDEFLEVESQPDGLQNVQPSDDSSMQSNTQQVDDSDLTTDVLNMIGISDPQKIKFRDTSGAVIERSWDSLSRDEQLAILTQHEDLETSLDDDEIMLINSIRSSQLTPQQYINRLNQQYLDQVYASQQPVSQVDNMDDDYLYVLDLLDKVGSDNITDEELEQSLANAKQNEEIFKKQVEGLRAQYKNREQEVALKRQEAQQAQQQAMFNQFANNVTTGINNLKYLANQEIELTPYDKEELADYILNLNDNGMSQFGIDLNNTDRMVEAAFFMKKGPEILDELSKQIQIAYKRGYDRARLDIGNKSTMVFNPIPKPVAQDEPFFDADEDDWD